MGNSMVKINVHLVFHIKSTSVPMHPMDLPYIFEYIGGILQELGTVPITVGGIFDHIHLLTSLPSTMSIADLMRTVKAKSSRWIKSLSLEYNTFRWQDGYGAFSVSPSLLDKTIHYIKNQQQHHRRRSFQEEYKKMLDAYHIHYEEKYLFND